MREYTITIRARTRDAESSAPKVAAFVQNMLEQQLQYTSRVVVETVEIVGIQLTQWLEQK